MGVYGDVAIKAPCRVATTANITLNGLQTVDGVVLAQDDRVLVKNQTSAIDNGIYTADTGDWSRALDFNGPRDCVQGTLVLVLASGSNPIGWSLYELTTTAPVIGTSSLAFTATGVAPLEASTLVVETKEDLLDLVSRPELVWLEGLTTVGDGKGGPVYWDAGSTTTADDILVFNPPAGQAGRYKRAYSNYLNVQTDDPRALFWVRYLSVNNVVAVEGNRNGFASVVVNNNPEDTLSFPTAMTMVGYGDSIGGITFSLYAESHQSTTGISTGEIAAFQEGSPAPSDYPFESSFGTTQTLAKGVQFTAGGRGNIFQATTVSGSPILVVTQSDDLVAPDGARIVGTGIPATAHVLSSDIDLETGQGTITMTQNATASGSVQLKVRFTGTLTSGSNVLTSVAGAVDAEVGSFIEGHRPNDNDLPSTTGIPWGARVRSVGSGTLTLELQDGTDANVSLSASGAAIRDISPAAVAMEIMREGSTFGIWQYGLAIAKDAVLGTAIILDADAERGAFNGADLAIPGLGTNLILRTTGTAAPTRSVYEHRNASGIVKSKITQGGVLTLNANAVAPPAAPTGTMFHAAQADGVGTNLLVDVFAETANLSYRRANGTAASPSAVLLNNALARIQVLGYGATGYSTSRAGVVFQATENWTDSAQGARGLLSATPAGSTTIATTAIWDGDNFKVNTGKSLWLGNAYQAGDPTTTGYLLVTDVNGTVYRIPAMAN